MTFILFCFFFLYIVIRFVLFLQIGFDSWLIGWFSTSRCLSYIVKGDRLRIKDIANNKFAEAEKSQSFLATWPLGSFSEPFLVWAPFDWISIRLMFDFFFSLG